MISEGAPPLVGAAAAARAPLRLRLCCVSDTQWHLEMRRGERTLGVAARRIAGGTWEVDALFATHEAALAQVIPTLERRLAMWFELVTACHQRSGGVPLPEKYDRLAALLRGPELASSGEQAPDPAHGEPPKLQGAPW